jgi:hypothetical protein
MQKIAVIIPKYGLVGGAEQHSLAKLKAQNRKFKLIVAGKGNIKKIRKSTGRTSRLILEGRNQNT